MSHAPGGYTGLVPCDEVLEPFDFGLLPFIGFQFLLFLYLVHSHEVLVVACVSGQVAAFQVIYNVYY